MKTILRHLVKRAKVLFYAEKKNEMHYMSDIIAILLTFLSLLTLLLLYLDLRAAHKNEKERRKPFYITAKRPSSPFFR